MDTNDKTSRTKCALAEALAKAMETEPLDKISVQEIADACGIRRQSFYYHFEDIYGLLEWTLERDRDYFAERRAGLLCWQEYVLMLLRFFDENRKHYVNISGCVGWQFIERFYRPELHEVVSKAVDYYSTGVGERGKYTAFLTMINFNDKLRNFNDKLGNFNDKLGNFTPRV